VVTITFALPSVLALIKHLRGIKHQLKYSSSICYALLASMTTRFDGMLQRVQVTKEHLDAKQQYAGQAGGTCTTSSQVFLHPVLLLSVSSARAA